MARLLSNIILKGIGGYPVANSARIISGSSCQNRMKYFSIVPNDPDTHEDFRPTSTSKLESHGLSLKDIVEQGVNDNPVMIYMKGVPDFPQGRFSSLAVRGHYNVPISARNILEDLEIKNAVKGFRFGLNLMKVLRSRFSI